MNAATTRKQDGVDLYLDLLKRAVTGLLARRPHVADRRSASEVDIAPLADRAAREEGRDWPAEGETMVGLRRLDNVEHCVDSVLSEGVSGDLIEAGVWRGGVTIFMRGLLKARGVEGRTVWAADSFEGLPRPDAENYPADADDRHHLQPFLAVTLDEVRSNFARYGLLDEGVRFVPGWFKDTLPPLADHPWSVIRIDADMYESTLTALRSLYPSLSPGGYVIVDDYGAIPSCRRAVDDFRSENGIDDEIQQIDWTGIYWKRPR
jgi:O-methyltransferase